MRFPSAASAVLFVASSVAVGGAYAEATTVATDADQAVDYTQIDLSELTNDELVAICTDRGFELVFELDDASEEPLEYTHEDYIDAARECLKLEAEMDAFYEENPEMVREMKEERERMLKEQEELEQKLREAQDKLEKEKAKKKSDGIADGGAFVKKGAQEEEILVGGDDTDAPPLPGTSERNMSSEKSSKENRKDELSSEDEIIDLDDDTMNEVIAESRNTKANQSSDGTEEEPRVASGVASSDVTNESSAIDAAPTSIASATDDGLIIEFKEVYAEFCEKVKQDFERIANIVVPKPLRGPLKEGLSKGYTIAKDASVKVLAQVKSSGLYEKAKEDAIRIVDIIVPQSARGPLRMGLKTGIDMVKDGAIKGAEMAKRYGSALLEKGMATYKKIQQEQEERKQRERQQAASEGATVTS